MWKIRTALLLVVVVLSGCGSPTATVSGKVTYKGRTVTSGSVIVMNPDGTTRSWVIQPDGTYEVKGMQRGHLRFAVLCPDPAKANSILVPRKSAGKDGKKAKQKSLDWFPLPAALGNPESSGLECEATSSQVHHDLEIK